MMGSSSGGSCSPTTGPFAVWFVDSADSAVPLTHASSLQDFPEKRRGTASSSETPLLLLSPPETCRGDESTFPMKSPQGTFSRRNALRRTRPGRLQAGSCSPPKHTEKERKSDKAERNQTVFFSSEEEPKPPGGGNLLLPRSSPVLSRRPRPLSWHGRRTPPADPSSLELLSSSGSASLKSSSVENLGCTFPVQVDEDQNNISASDWNSISSSDRNSISSSDQNSISASDRNSISASDQNSISASDQNSISASDQNSISSSDRNSISSSDRNSISSSDRNSISASDRNSLLSSHSQPRSVDGDSRQIFEGRGNEEGSTSSSRDRERAFSGVSDFTADIFKACCELEKENAHFIVVDMVMEILEGAKWTLSFDQRTALMEKHQNTERNTQNHTSSAQRSPPPKQNCRTHRPTQDHSKHDGEPSGDDTKTSHTQSDGHQGKDDGESRKIKPEQPKMCSVLSTDSGFEDCGLDIPLTSTESDRNSAECLAQRLVSQFKRNWLPSHKLWRGRLSLRSSLQELPGTEGVVSSRGSLAEEIQIRTRMRGSLTWAPPCFQIIFTLHPAHRRSEMVALQNFLCAGCGTEVEPRYIKKLRYCEYLGRYFCDCCHSGSEAVIPARILSCWDFSRYSVSDFSKHLLDSVWHEPLFDLTCVGTALCSRVKELSKFRDLQEQLMGIKKLLKACRFSKRVLAEFDQFPAHLTDTALFFSLNDLLMAKKGQLAAPARALLLSAVSHVESCELCLSRGFICELCRQKDVIFPFQRNVCKRCKVCRACFHKHCFMGRNCPKCARIKSRNNVPMRP